MLKSNIRKKIIKIRKNRNKYNIRIKFNHVYGLLKKITDLKKKIIGGYYPVNYEIDDLDILRQLEKKKVKIAGSRYFPVMSPMARNCYHHCVFWGRWHRKKVQPIEKRFTERFKR